MVRPDWLNEEIERQKVQREEEIRRAEAQKEARKEATRKEKERRHRVREERRERARKERDTGGLGEKDLKERAMEAALENRKIEKNSRRAGLIGAAIPGSKLIRDFCACCGEAIRVCNVGQKNFCLECMDRHTDFGGGMDEAAKHDMDYHGGRFYSGEW